MERVSVVLADRRDVGLDGAFEVLRTLSEAFYLRSLLVVRIGAEDLAGNSELLAKRLEHGHWQELNLLDEIQVVPASKIELVSACTASVEPEAQSALNRQARQLYLKMQQGASPEATAVHDIRLYFPLADEVHPRGGFFSNAARFNFVVVPEDREHDAAFARSIDSIDTERFGWHAAMELATVAGLWTSMGSSPTDQLTYGNPERGDPNIRLVRSMVRTTTAVRPSITDLFDGSSSLPEPVGFQMAPNQFEAAATAAVLCHHPDFQWEKPAASTQDLRLGPWKVLRMALGKIVSRFWGLPNAFRRGVKDEIASVAAETAQAVVGRDSRVRVVPRSTGDTRFDAESVVAEVEAQIPSVPLRRQYDDAWHDTIEEVLGVVDGSSTAEWIREEVGDRTFLVVNRAALIPESGPNIGAVVGALDEVRVDGPEPSGLLRLLTQRFRAEYQSIEQRYELFRSKILLLGNDASRTRADATITVCQWGSVILAVLAATTLTSYGEQFRFQDLGADGRFVAFLFMSALVATPLGRLLEPGYLKFGQAESQSGDSDHSRGRFGSALARMGSAGASLARGFARMGRAAARLRLACARLKIRGRPYMALFLFGIWVPTIFFAVFASYLREPITDRRIFQWLLGGLVVAGIGAVYLSISIRTRGDALAEFRKSDLWYRIQKWASPFYLMAVVIIGINRSTYQPGWSDDVRHRFLLFCLIVAAVTFVLSNIAAAVIDVRKEWVYKNLESDLEYLKEQMLQTGVEKQVTSNLHVHWLGTAAVLERLIRWPYGPTSEVENAEVGRGVGSASVRKFGDTVLNLTESGLDDFYDKVKPVVSPPRYLTNQYQTISSAFAREQEAARRGTGQFGSFEPEHCTYPLDLEDALTGTAGGLRWPFAYQVYAGEFDEALRQSVESELGDALLEAFVQEPGWLDSAEGHLPPEGLGSVFANIVPPEIVDLPTGNLGEMVAARIGPSAMTPYVWWPSDIGRADPQGPHLINLFHSPAKNVGRSLILQAVRVDISDEIRLSVLRSGPPPPDSPIPAFLPEAEDEDEI